MADIPSPTSHDGVTTPPPALISRGSPDDSLGSSAGAEVLRLDRGTAVPTAYELFFDLEPHVNWAIGGSAPPSPIGKRKDANFPSSFYGRTKIHVTAVSNLRTITLHALQLDIERIAWAVRTEDDDLPIDPVGHGGGAPGTRSASVDADSVQNRSLDRDPLAPPPPQSQNAAAGGGGTPAVDPAASPGINPDGSGPVPDLLDHSQTCLKIPECANNVETWKLDAESETLRFELGETIAGNRQIVIYIEYRGLIANKSIGMFMSEKATDKLSIATHLEPTNARRLYPCFDEPSFQAKFRVSVRAPDLPHYVLLSNTREVMLQHQLLSATHTSLSCLQNAPNSTTTRSPSAQPQNAASQLRALREASEGATGGTGSSAGVGSSGLNPAGMLSITSEPMNATTNSTSGIRFVTTTFRTTPAIPPYLVAFVFARLHCIEAETTSGVLTRVYLPHTQALENAWFTIDLLKKAVEFFENYFDFPLPMEKIDIVAVANVTFMGMENWGLLIFKDDYVAVSEATRLERQQRIARLVAHEVAHQWFGNLVAIQWWRYIWLKEGLARFLEFVFVNSAFPKWDMWMSFMVDVENPAMIADANIARRHPVEQGAGLRPREICDLFDVISYGKAAAIMRMATNSIGGDQYMSAALRQFIHRHAWGSASSDDLFQCLSDQLRVAASSNAAAAAAVVQTSLATRLPTAASTSSISTNGSSSMTAAAGGGAGGATTLESLLNGWVTTSGPAYLYVRSDASSDDLRSGAAGASGFVTIHVRVLAAPDLHYGFVRAILERPVSPRNVVLQQNIEGDPLLLNRTRDRNTRAARPSSIVLHVPEQLSTLALPVPIQASAIVGTSVLAPESVGVTSPSVAESRFTISTQSPSASTTSPSPAISTGLDAGGIGAPPGMAAAQDGSSSDVVPHTEPAAGPIAILVNPHQHVPCRIDYDSALWWRIVETVMQRPAKERLSVAMSLFELRTTLIGVENQSDAFDRCCLLLRFLYELGTHKESHAVVWGYVSDALHNFITLIQDQPCWMEVRLLIIYAHKHLIGSRGICFPTAQPPKDPVLDYNASHDLSAKHRTAILSTLARCGEHEVVADAKTYVEWILSAFSAPNASASPVGGQPLGGGSYGGSYQEGASLLANANGDFNVLAPAPQLYVAPPEKLVDCSCDLMSLPMEYVALAFETTLANAESSRLWYATLQLFSFALHGDPQAITSRFPANTLNLVTQEAFIVDPRHYPWMPQKSSQWIEALFPAILACPLTDARNAQAELLKYFTMLSAPCLRVLVENSNLLTKFVDELPVAEAEPTDVASASPQTGSSNAVTATSASSKSPLLAAIRRYVAKYSANALIAVSLLDKKIGSRTELLANSTWADYVNEHYAWYVKRNLLQQVAPADASVFSEIASKSLTGSNAAHDSTPDSFARRCSI